MSILHRPKLSRPAPAPLAPVALPDTTLGRMDLRPYLAERRVRCVRCGARDSFGDSGNERCGSCGNPCGVVDRISWVIVGGESGRFARPFNMNDAQKIVADCAAAGVPVFVKQLGDYPVDASGARCFPNSDKGGDLSEFPLYLAVRQFPSTAIGG